MPPIVNQPGHDHHGSDTAPAQKRNYRTFTVRTLLAATALVAVLVTLWMALQPKKYVAAFLQVKNTPPGSVIAPVKFDLAEMQAFREKQIERLHSDLVLRHALKYPGISQLSIVRGRSDPVAWLRANLETEYVGGSEILRVQLASSRPDEAVKLVNAVVRAYFDDCVWEAERKKKQHRDTLQQVYDQRMQDARQRRKELIELATTAGAAKTGEKPAQKDAELARREALAEKAFLELEQAKMEANAPPRVVMGEEAQISK
jgi:hypothetical protein